MSEMSRALSRREFAATVGGASVLLATRQMQAQESAADTSGVYGDRLSSTPWPILGR